MKRVATLLLAAMILVGMMTVLVSAATTVTVTDTAGVNIRSGPGTTYERVGGLAYGAQAVVLSTETVDGYIWGKLDNGWIRLDFTDYQQSSQPGNPGVNGGWSLENGKWYYYQNGVKATGWLFVGGVWYYLDNTGAMATGWQQVGGKWYYLNESGVMQTGWLQRGASWYYLDASGAMATGWLQLEGSWYYLDASGVMAVGKVKIEGKAHKFSLDGVWLGETQNAFSADAMTILKAEEGFSVKPYWDYSQWTVGYGTRCPDDMLDYYKTYGISVADAEILLRKHMAEIENAVDRFAVKQGLTFSQGQYDALVLLSYNCGTGWCTETTGTLHNAIKNRATGNDLLRAFALWSTAGGEIKDFLVRRRLSEANMYLNGVYSKTPPENFCYVIYDANGGTVSPRIQAYDSLLTAVPSSVPTCSGYTFDGWYTAASGGTKVTVLNAGYNKATLYAHWVGLTPDPAPEQGVAYVTVTVTNGPVNVRTGPGVDYPKLKIETVANGVTLNLSEYAVETISGGVRRWGKFAEYGGGWVCLDYTNYDTVKQSITAGRWAEINGKLYFFLGIEAQSGWQFYNNQWYFTDATGAMVTGWLYQGGQWYYLGADGVMVTGTVTIGNQNHSFASSGVWLGETVLSGWVLESGVWYYYQNGVKATGWLYQSGTWYYLDGTGAMATRWRLIGGAWYYFNGAGAMVTGNYTIDGKMHSFAASGAWLGEVPQDGWAMEGGVWYYYVSGAKATGWLYQGGTWYYLDATGAMVTGWQMIGGIWYYFYGNGAMVTGTVVIGPNTYVFDNSGAWIG